MVDSAADAPGLPGDVDRALAARALAWLAQREYSRHELRNKLMRHRPQLRPAGRGGTRDRPEAADGEPAPDPLAQHDVELVDRRSHSQRVDAVLDWLERNQHLSQQRFVESRLHSRSERYGNARIRQELAQHGVAMSAELDASLQASEFDRACAVWQRKFGGRSIPTPPADMAKQVRFLASRGFSSDVIRRVLREIEAASAVAARVDPVAPANVRVDVAHAAGTPDTLAPPRAGSRLRLISGGRRKPGID